MKIHARRVPEAGWQQARHACDRGDRACPRENGRLLLAEPAPSCSHVAFRFRGFLGRLVLRGSEMSISAVAGGGSVGGSRWDGLVGRGECRCCCHKIEHPSCREIAAARGGVDSSARKPWPQRVKCFFKWFLLVTWRARLELADTLAGLAEPEQAGLVCCQDYVVFDQS